ncbi:MAG TPA: penicillin-binding protein 1A [Xanthomonadaceae bacterium]|jgi:penicillin-binding protein 1A|nr:penicillin-binding protein 1A [Xanthomonadaceae bacterium]
MARLFRWLRRALYAGLFLLVLASAALGVVYWLIVPRLPDVDSLRHVEMQLPMNVYTREGRLIAQFGETRRIPVGIKDVPDRVRKAFLATEDAHFYEHPGVDWRGISRAVWLIATTHEHRVPGGSTITQQVARQFFLSNEYSYTRKLSEILLALKIERELSKDEIFELYLNKCFFGNRAYGVAAASEYYYGKKLDQLSLDEAASLAAIPKFPSSGNPLSNPERARERRDYVLDRMAEEHFISAADRDQAKAVAPHASQHEPPVEVDAPYVAEMVRQAMLDRYGSDALNRGYKVYTTIDATKQAAANLALRNDLLVYDRRHGYRGPEVRLDLNAETDRAALLQKLQARGAYGGLLPGVVTQTSAVDAHVLLSDGDEVTIGLDDVRWALAGKTRVDALLARGDVIRLLPITKADKENQARIDALSKIKGQADADKLAPPPPDIDPDAGKIASYQLNEIPKAQSALISLEPEDGALRALVGGFSFAQTKFNRATQALRQPGSSFKPFIYAAAMERGFSPASLVLDAPVVFNDHSSGKVWRPQNDDGKFFGPMRLREALALSRNLVSVRLLDTIGVDFARKYIQNFGFTEQSLPNNLTMALGTASVPPLWMARGYTVFANSGYLVEPYFIDRVVDRDGVTISRAHPLRACQSCVERTQQDEAVTSVVDGFDLAPVATATPAASPAGSDASDKGDGFDLDAHAKAVSSAASDQAANTNSTTPSAPIATAPPVPPIDPDFVGPPSVFPAHRAIDERTAFLVMSMMKDVIKHGTGTPALVLHREDIGGKTGTTNDMHDAWFSGYGGHLVTTVWVGMDDFSTLGHSEFGARAALPIWIDYMRVALADVPESTLDPPPGIVTAQIDRGSGRILPAGSTGGMTEYFKAEELERFQNEVPGTADTTTNNEEAFDIF